MDAMRIEMVVVKGDDEMEPIIKELKERYNPKQIFCHKVKYFER